MYAALGARFSFDHEQSLTFEQGARVAAVLVTARFLLIDAFNREAAGRRKLKRTGSRPKPESVPNPLELIRTLGVAELDF